MLNICKKFFESDIQVLTRSTVKNKAWEIYFHHFLWGIKDKKIHSPEVGYRIKLSKVVQSLPLLHPTHYHYLWFSNYLLQIIKFLQMC